MNVAETKTFFSIERPSFIQVTLSEFTGWERIEDISRINAFKIRISRDRARLPIHPFRKDLRIRVNY